MSKTARKQAKKAPARKTPASHSKGAKVRAATKTAAKAKTHKAAPAKHAPARPQHAKATGAQGPCRQARAGEGGPAEGRSQARCQGAGRESAGQARACPGPRQAARCGEGRTGGQGAAGKAPSSRACERQRPPRRSPPAVVAGKKGKGARPGNEKFDIALPPSTPEDRQSQLKLLIARGKEQSFLTYAEVNDHLPSEIVDPEQIEDIVQMINDMGIPVYEKAPDAEALLLREPVVADDEAAEEAAAALAHGRRGVRPHHRPGPHVHARDGHGRAAHARGRDLDRQAHRGGPRRRAQRAVAVPADLRPDARGPTSR